MSQQTGISYALLVYLPAGYDQGSTAYPVIYQMDQESRFVRRSTCYATGVSMRSWQASATWARAGASSTFEMPGAAACYRLLTLELVPFIVPLCATIKARSYAGLQMRMQEYGSGHVPMDVHAFGDSLDFIF